MIGKIVGWLLTVNCLSFIVTEAQLSSSACLNYTTKASFEDIVGFAYAEEYSKPNVPPCLTLNIQPVASLLGSKIFTSISSIYAFGLAISAPPSFLLENPKKDGQAESYLGVANGLFNLERISVIVGYEGNATGFQGYALAACGADGTLEVAIVLKKKPPQSDVVSKLKMQLIDNGLQDVQLQTVSHRDTCVYPIH